MFQFVFWAVGLVKKKNKKKKKTLWKKKREENGKSRHFLEALSGRNDQIKLIYP